MAILKIARMGHPVLRRPAEAVSDLDAPDLQRLIEDMVETMRDAEGAGLAAPQVHRSLRLIVFAVGPNRLRGEEVESDSAADAESGAGAGVPLTVLINPDYAPLDEEKDEAWEACLSIPGLAGRVPRYRHIRYWGTAPDGSTVEREAKGFHARVVQHECDHLDGVLLTQRMADMSTLIFTSEMNRFLEGEAEAQASDFRHVPESNPGDSHGESGTNAA